MLLLLLLQSHSSFLAFCTKWYSNGNSIVLSEFKYSFCFIIWPPAAPESCSFFSTNLFNHCTSRSLADDDPPTTRLQWPSKAWPGAFVGFNWKMISLMRQRGFQFYGHATVKRFMKKYPFLFFPPACNCWRFASFALVKARFFFRQRYSDTPLRTSTGGGWRRRRRLRFNDCHGRSWPTIKQWDKCPESANTFGGPGPDEVTERIWCRVWVMMVVVGEVGAAAIVKQSLHMLHVTGRTFPQLLFVTARQMCRHCCCCCWSVRPSGGGFAFMLTAAAAMLLYGWTRSPQGFCYFYIFRQIPKYLSYRIVIREWIILPMRGRLKMIGVGVGRRQRASVWTCFGGSSTEQRLVVCPTPVKCE